MAESTVTFTPSTPTRVLGAEAVADLLHRVRRPDYHSWLAHVTPASACSHPIRLRLEAEWHGPNGRSEIERVSDDVPDGVFYVPCKNRRASVCPACAETYRADTFHLIRSGLIGGKGVPHTVTEHPAFFVTFTAPSFGAVHTRTVAANGQVKPCRMRRTIQACPHGRYLVCHERHDEDDPRLGTALCRDCYDYHHQAVWNLYSGELWRRTTIALNRGLRRAALDRDLYAWQGEGKHRRKQPLVRLSYAKVAEMQRRGVVHFHALIRIDGLDPANPDRIVAPDPAITPELVHELITSAAHNAFCATLPHPSNRDGWPITWGDQIDIRRVRLQPEHVDDTGVITELAVAAYLAKYATKATEATGHVSRRLTELDVELRTEQADTHQTRQLQACWTLGRRPFWYTHPDQHQTWEHGERKLPGWGRLQRWAHMLGFGGHFSTKSRRYSTTLTALRAIRRAYQLGHQPQTPQHALRLLEDEHNDTTIVTLTWTFDGIGWLTTADAQLANTAAAKARERQQAARDELHHQQAS